MRDGGPESAETGDGAVPGTLVAAVVIGALEALALIAAAVFTLVSTITGNPDDLGRALLLAALAAVGAAVREILGDDRYRRRARELEAAFAQRDGVAEIAALLDEVIAEHRSPGRGHGCVPVRNTAMSAESRRAG